MRRTSAVLYLLGELVSAGHTNALGCGWTVQLELTIDASVFPRGRNSELYRKENRCGQHKRRLANALQ